MQMTSLVRNLPILVVVTAFLSQPCGCTQPENEPPENNKPKGQETPRDVLRKIFTSCSDGDKDSFRECYLTNDETTASVDMTFEETSKFLELRAKLTEVYGSSAVDYFARSNPEEKFGLIVGWESNHEAWWETVEIIIDGEKACYSPPHAEPLMERLERRDGVWRHVPRNFGQMIRPENIESLHELHHRALDAMDFAIERADPGYSYQDLKREMTRIWKEGK